MHRPTLRGLALHLSGLLNNGPARLLALLLALAVLATGSLQAQQGRVGIGTRLDEHDKALAQHDQELSALRGELSEVRAELSAFADRLDRLARAGSQPAAGTSRDTSAGNQASGTPAALAGLRQQVEAMDAGLEELQRQVRQLRQRGGTASPPTVVRGTDCCGEVPRLREHVADVRLMLETQATAITHLERDMRRAGQEEVLARLEARAHELQSEFEAQLEQLGKLLVFSRTAGGGLLAIHNSQEQRAGSLFAFDSGHGALQINNADGERRLLLSVDENGNGEVHLYDANGEIKLWLSGEGKIVLNGVNVKDQAEVFELTRRDGVVPGTVLAITDDGRLAPSSEAYDPRVIGVVSGAGGLQPGLVLGAREDGSTDLPVALNGQIYVRVNSEGGPVRPGDLLVPSDRPGIAMRAADRQRAFGAVLGKALESFDGGDSPSREGLVRMLVMVR